MGSEFIGSGRALGVELGSSSTVSRSGFAKFVFGSVGLIKVAINCLALCYRFVI